MNSTNAITRSHFLRRGLHLLVKNTAEFVADSVKKNLDKAVIPLHRPPGAEDELNFLLKCTRCDKCIEACPHDALQKAGTKYGSAAGTPFIKPSDNPCYLCEDFPCITACKDNALLPVTGLFVKMGDAHLIRNRCFAYKGQVCDYCYTNCPSKGKAIIMENGKPQIIAESCTGCGICEYLCPAPKKAIMVLPARPGFSGERKNITVS